MAEKRNPVVEGIEEGIELCAGILRHLMPGLEKGGEEGKSSPKQQQGIS